MADDERDLRKQASVSNLVAATVAERYGSDLVKEQPPELPKIFLLLELVEFLSSSEMDEELRLCSYASKVVSSLESPRLWPAEDLSEMDEKEDLEPFFSQ